MKKLIKQIFKKKGSTNHYILNENTNHKIFSDASGAYYQATDVDDLVAGMSKTVLDLRREKELLQIEYEKLAKFNNELTSVIDSSLVGDDLFVPIFERDIDDPIKSNGAIIFETYINKSGFFDVLQFVIGMGSKYGKGVVCKISPLTNKKVAELIAKKTKILIENEIADNKKTN